MVFGFTVVVFGFALISSRLAWYRCGIRLRCGGIRLRPNHFWGLTGGGRSAGSWGSRDRSVEGDNTLFISIVLEEYSLYALHLAIPPPWGFHLSNPPNIKSYPREEIKSKNSREYTTKDQGEGVSGK